MLRKTSAQRAAPLSLTIRPLDPFSEASGVGWRMRTTPANERKIKIHILFLLLDTEHDDTHRSPTHTHTRTHTRNVQKLPLRTASQRYHCFDSRWVISSNSHLVPEIERKNIQTGDMWTMCRALTEGFRWFISDFTDLFCGGGFRCRNFCIKTLHNHFRHSVSCCRFISVQHRPLVRSAGTEGEPHWLHNSYKYTVYL